MARRVDRMAGAGSGRASTSFAMDVTDDASHDRRASSGSSTSSGRIDVLVNNAGYGSYGALEDVPIDEARRQFEVNVFGLARLIQLVTPHMRERSESRPDHQHLLDRREVLRAARRVVPRHQVRRRGLQRQPADRAAAARHRRRDHRARPDPHRVERDLPREPGRRPAAGGAYAEHGRARSRAVLERADRSRLLSSGPESSPRRS